MIGFISDVHGNYPALCAVLKEFDRMGCRQIISLGDVCGYYSQVNECIGALRDRNAVCLLGNHDYYLISGTCCSSKTVQMCIEFQRGIITPDNVTWLRTLTPSLDEGVFSLRHGGWDDPMEERLERFDFAAAALLPQTKFLSGHTHMQRIERTPMGDDRWYCNPGSVGQPRDGDPRAAFAVVDDLGEIHIHRIEYNIDMVALEMQKNGLGDWIWKNLYCGKQIGAQ